MNNFRFIEEKIAKVLMLFSVLVVSGFVFSVIYTIFLWGLPVLTWSMISQLPVAVLRWSGWRFLNAIIGSVYIVGASTVIGLSVSIPVVFYLNVYLKRNSRFGYLSRLAFDVLFGIPSIVYGAFGFTIMIYMGLRASLLGASL